MAKKPLSKLGVRVFARLKEKGMSLAQLERLMEEKTGMFLQLGYLDKRLRGKRRLHPCVYAEIKGFLGEPVETKRNENGEYHDD